MLRSNTLFVVFLLVLSAISGWLIHRMSLLGRFGVSFIYREFGFMKDPVKAGAAVFGVLLLLFFIQLLATRSLKRSSANVFNTVMLIVGIAGLYAMYNNFRTDITHRLLNERFHLGFYLVAIGSICTGLYFLITGAGQSRLSKPEVVIGQQGSERI